MEETHPMNFVRPITTAAAVVTVGAGLTFATPALAAAPPEFTMKGVAKSYNQGKVITVPNTLTYDHGRVRLDMAQPVSADGASSFSVVIAREGGDTITMLSPKDKQAMKLDAASVEALSDNAALQKISTFRLSEFGKTFRSKGKKVGTATIAGEACTILEQNGKEGHFRMWLSNRYDLPFKFVYFEAKKPAFEYQVTTFTPRATLPDSAYVVPKGYEVTDLAEALKDTEINIRNKGKK
jgi:hypothetical protein